MALVPSCSPLEKASLASSGRSTHADASAIFCSSWSINTSAVLAALAEDGAIWNCGRGADGKLGHGDVQDRLRPTRLGPEAWWTWCIWGSQHHHGDRRS